MYPSQEDSVAGQWVFVPNREEVPVTFQIGIVANNGVILASDKAATHLAGKVDSISITDKIKFSNSPMMCYCWAGDDTLMSSVVRRFLAKVDSKPNLGEQIIKSLEEAAWDEFKALYGPLESPSPCTQSLHRESSMLVACPCFDGTKLFRLGFSRTPSVNIVHDKTVEGLAGNAAAFFLERYYRSFANQDRTVEALLPVAAHCILMGGKVNPNVHGLELALCTKEECKLIHNLADLLKFSSQLDSEIAKRLGCT